MLFADYVYGALCAPDKGLFVWGSVFPDIGYFGKKRLFSDRLHEDRGVVFLKALFNKAEGEEERAFLLGWASHVVLDQMGHPRWTHCLMRKRGACVEDDELHRRIEWGLGRVSCARVKAFSLLSFEPPGRRLFRWIEAEFERFFGINLGGFVERDFCATVRNLKELIPLSFKLTPVFKPFSAVAGVIPAKVVEKAYPVIFSQKASLEEQNLAFEVFKASGDYFRKVLDSGLDALREESLDGI